MKRMVNVGGCVYLLYVVCAKSPPPLFHSFQSSSQPCRFLEASSYRSDLSPFWVWLWRSWGRRMRSVVASETADADDFQ